MDVKRRRKSRKKKQEKELDGTATSDKGDEFLITIY
jgi:hypothetical protein